jgi:hypothetical protein
LSKWLRHLCRLLHLLDLLRHELNQLLKLRQLGRDDLKELLHVLELLLLHILQLLQMLQLLRHDLQNVEDLLQRLAVLLRREWTPTQSKGPVWRESKRDRLRSGVRDWGTKAKHTSSHEASLMMRRTIRQATLLMPTLSVFAITAFFMPRNLRARALSAKHAEIASCATLSCRARAPLRRTASARIRRTRLTSRAFLCFRGDRLRLWRCVPYRCEYARFATTLVQRFSARQASHPQSIEELDTNQLRQLVFCSA